jgi:hypothetical protein
MVLRKAVFSSSDTCGPSWFDGTLSCKDDVDSKVNQLEGAHHRSAMCSKQMPTELKSPQGCRIYCHTADHVHDAANIP